jgi:hypothetical protein
LDDNICKRLILFSKTKTKEDEGEEEKEEGEQDMLS